MHVLVVAIVYLLFSFFSQQVLKQNLSVFSISIHLPNFTLFFLFRPPGLVILVVITQTKKSSWKYEEKKQWVLTELTYNITIKEQLTTSLTTVWKPVSDDFIIHSKQLHLAFY